jgi:hypothetical protein
MCRGATAQRRREQAAQERAKLLAAVVDVITDGILIYDRDTRLLRGLVCCTADGIGITGICSWRNILQNAQITAVVTEVNAESYAALRALADLAVLRATHGRCCDRDRGVARSKRRKEKPNEDDREEHVRSDCARGHLTISCSALSLLPAPGTTDQPRHVIAAGPRCPHAVVPAYNGETAASVRLAC